MTSRCSATVLVAALAGVSATASAQTLPQGIATGDTRSIPSTTAGAVRGYGTAWARTTAAGPVTFEFSATPDFATILQTGTVQVTDTTEPAKFNFFRLLLTSPVVYYRVTDAAGTVQMGRTVIPWIDQRLGLRFGVSGDWRGELSPYPAIANADELGLDLFIELGDTIYADFPSPAVPLAQATTLAELRAKHAEVYSERFGMNTWADLRAVTPVLATIDDHEVTNDFEGGASRAGLPLFATPAGVPFVNDTDLYRDGIRAFVEYNPIVRSFYAGTDPADRFASAPNLYRERVYGKDAAFFVLDARSFRDPGIPEVTNPADPVQVGTFLATAFTPGRTMLGDRQLGMFLDDLASAQQDGVTWKFVFVPEPIQNLGVLAASDRFEGYAAERTQILSFIEQNGIDNVVFVAADIHGTVINNLTYQLGPFQPQLESQAFEVTTGSVAFDAPFGPTVVNIAGALGAAVAGGSRGVLRLAPAGA